VSDRQITCILILYENHIPVLGQSKFKKQRIYVDLEVKCL